MFSSLPQSEGGRDTPGGEIKMADNVKDFTSEAMDRWRQSVEVSKKCGEQVKDLSGEKAMEEYLACRTNPEKHGIE